MKPKRTLGPLWLWPVTLIIVGWLARAGWHLRSENETLRTVAAAAGKVDASMGTRSTPEPMNGLQEGTVRAEALRDETRREIASREAAEAKIAELESHLPTRDGEVLTSFGRIEEMGKRAGKAVTFLARQAAAQTAAQKPRGKPVTDLDLTKDEQAAFAEFFGQLGELRALENDPREIARFQAATLREVLGLDDATSGRVSAFLEAEFARLKAQQLTANFRPENEPGDWYRRRDAAMTELAARLRPLLPANHAQLPLLPGILSLGGGLRTEVKLNPDGHGTVNAMLPLFPKWML
jgi:hypothetical protein